MIRRTDLRETPAGTTPAQYRALLPRAPFDVEAAVEVVRPVVDDVRHRGEAAVLDATERFDQVQRASLAVPAEEADAALASLAPDVRAALEESIRRLRATCEAELDRDVVTDLGPGARVERRIVPVGRVGLYVPGGLAPLVSSVIMNAVPAQVAGVRSLALATPPQREYGGAPHPTVLAACALLGVDEVYAVGGAQAIAMFAYGAGPCEPVDLVTGPGNIYVVAAKRLVQSVTGIDSEAGPTEIAILADDTATPAFVAADLISQAEHDPLAAAVLVTPSPALADAVDEELARQVPAAKHAQRIETALTSTQSATVLVRDVQQGLEVVNAYAAEHLEIQTADAAGVASQVENAGAVFVGSWSPVSLGDYAAGSNHVLPTAGCACRSSGLSVRSFCKTMQVVTYDEPALREVGPEVVVLAEAEDLPSHGAAVSARLDAPEGRSGS
ncbi:histidinol dehydrogenase [Mumia sp. zg.B17]|uniref:histidinol dehydrogenase n=1 Tax=unclassified Mumia TaxID=2621872 RepID=UPI001C6EBB78|nr:MULTISPECIES: histidinol dehydrogenase [unclassified Mumia]MBW9206216.1 histidinol dehydrogenase [Mumia sp. zg.B17]MBW9211490.1 histidinol dehydrogenase [Mumia sp. zg.B21]MDD9350300.1 histidinol dehydrogenase [Mumia sp.]